jgi:hypothetical protein
MLITNSKQSTNPFFCKKCNYYTTRKSSFDKHLTTSKHNKIIENETVIEENITVNDVNKNICINCNKEYKSRVGLWKHKKTCLEKEKVLELTDKEMIQLLLKEKEELEKTVDKEQQVILELYKFIEYIGAIPSLVSYLGGGEETG